MKGWPKADRDLFEARYKKSSAERRVVKQALHWSKLKSSTARARDLGLACERLEEAQAVLDELREREAEQ